jgi:RNase P subunit RPR2
MAKNLPKQRNADAQARMKFLYEASEYMIKLHLKNCEKVKSSNMDGDKAMSPSSNDPQIDVKELVQNSQFLQLSRSYTKTMKEISKKAVIRM